MGIAATVKPLDPRPASVDLGFGGRKVGSVAAKHVVRRSRSLGISRWARFLMKRDRGIWVTAKRTDHPR